MSDAHQTVFRPDLREHATIETKRAQKSAQPILDFHIDSLDGCPHQDRDHLDELGFETNRIPDHQIVVEGRGG